MLNFFTKRINKRKAKVFVLFLLASGLIWFLSTLSQTYSAKATFKIEYVNTNKNLKLTKAFTNRVVVKLKTGGFNFLGFNLQKKSIKVDLARAQKRGEKYYLAPKDYSGQIEKQLSKSMVLVEMVTDTLFFNLFEITSKEVPVQSNVKLNLAHNFLLEGDLQIEPPTITIFGPKEEIDSIKAVRAVTNDLIELNADFSKKVTLYKAPDLVNTSYSASFVQIKGKVSKFSEKLIEVPVEVINLPKNKQIRTFPEAVSVLCKAKIADLKILNATNFKVVADYSKLSSHRSEKLTLDLVKKPKNVFGASLMQNEVEYILNKE